MTTVPIDISYHDSRRIPSQFRRESFAHSQGMGGVSWGGFSVGSWLREEVMLNNLNAPAKPTAMSPEITPAYFPDLEADFCKDYTCCGKLLPTLHDLLRHYEDSHISPSPPVEPPVIRRMQNIEMVSTNEVFLGHQDGVSAPPSAAGSHISDRMVMPPQTHHIAGTPTQSSVMSHHSIMGTPIDTEKSFVKRMNSNNGGSNTPGGASNWQAKDEDDEMCIDDPARHLYVMERSDNKPFKCPVIGCEKTYKNQNGLKYHRVHGHQNQTLHLNDNGTYSIIDPLSNTPYPDGMGMEKDKPYRCEICGKRYKNLNGLKYHRAHSTH